LNQEGPQQEQEGTVRETTKAGYKYRSGAYEVNPKCARFGDGFAVLLNEDTGVKNAI
jgi:hypothetical protein